MKKIDYILTTLLIFFAALPGLQAESGIRQERKNEMMIYNICDYGAIPDGKTVNTAAIQKAIDSCHAAGGGRVMVPPGEFITGSVFMRSNVELHLAHGSMLKGSPDLAHYNKLDAYEQNYSFPPEKWLGYHLLIGVEVENCALTGSGIIDGNADRFYGKLPPRSAWGDLTWRFGSRTSRDLEKLRPGQMVVWVESKNIRVEDVTLQNATCWTMFFHGCENVRVSGVQILNPRSNINTDGIDIDASRFVNVSNCIIRTGDDALTLRNCAYRLKKKNLICENITVSNCVFETSASGVRIGVGKGMIRNAVFSNIVMSRAGVGVHIQSSYGRSRSKGTQISGIRFHDLIVRDCGAPLFVEPGTPYARGPIDDIAFSDCSFECYHSLKISGNEKNATGRIRLNNVDFTVLPATVPYKYVKRPDVFFSISGAEEVIFSNVRLYWKTGDPWWVKAFDVQNVRVFEKNFCNIPEPSQKR